MDCSLPGSSVHGLSTESPGCSPSSDTNRVALGKWPQFPVKCGAQKNGAPNKYQNKMARLLFWHKLKALNKLIDLESTL